MDTSVEVEGCDEEGGRDEELTGDLSGEVEVVRDVMDDVECDEVRDEDCKVEGVCVLECELELVAWAAALVGVRDDVRELEDERIREVDREVDPVEDLLDIARLKGFTGCRGRRGS